jgi:hypothetical protein
MAEGQDIDAMQFRNYVRSRRDVVRRSLYSLGGTDDAERSLRKNLTPSWERMHTQYTI